MLFYIRIAGISAIILSLCAVVAVAQDFGKVTPVPARLLDMSLLYPNYRWELDLPTDRMLRQQFGVSKWAEIVQQAQETAWPPGLRSRDDRDENRDRLCDVRVYFLRRFSIDKILLWVPAQENKHLPSYLQPATDIYFIMREGGMELIDTLKPAFPTTLEAQLDVLLREYVQGFSGIVDTSQVPSLTLEGKQEAVHLFLEGARIAYVNQSLDGHWASYTAIFPTQGNLQEAVAQYERLQKRISAARLTACPLVLSKEANVENRYYARFFTHDFTGDLDSRYKNLSLTLQLVRSYDHTARDTQPLWYSMLVLRPGY